MVETAWQSVRSRNMESATELLEWVERHDAPFVIDVRHNVCHPYMPTVVAYYGKNRNIFVVEPLGDVRRGSSALHMLRTAVARERRRIYGERGEKYSQGKYLCPRGDAMANTVTASSPAVANVIMEIGKDYGRE